MDLTILWWLLVGVLIAAGLVAAVLPVIPGPILIFAGILLAAWIDGFDYLGVWSLGILALLAVIAHALDIIAGVGGARAVGASRNALLGVGLGTVIGIFFGLPGILLGPFLGAVVGEMLNVKDFYHATRAGVGAWFGVIIGMAAKLAISFIMVGWFLILRFW